MSELYRRRENVRETHKAVIDFVDMARAEYNKDRTLEDEVKRLQLELSRKSDELCAARGRGFLLREEQAAELIKQAPQLVIGGLILVFKSSPNSGFVSYSYSSLLDSVHSLQVSVSIDTRFNDFRVHACHVTPFREDGLKGRKEARVDTETQSLEAAIDLLEQFVFDHVPDTKAHGEFGGDLRPKTAKIGGVKRDQ